MSKSVHYRLPDGLYRDLMAYAERSGISATEVVIKGIRLVTFENRVEPVPAVSEKPVSSVLPEAIKKAVEKKVLGGGYFRPMPKKN
jgi:hypothetical protein